MEIGCRTEERLRRRADTASQQLCLRFLRDFASRVTTVPVATVATTTTTPCSVCFADAPTKRVIFERRCQDRCTGHRCQCVDRVCVDCVMKMAYVAMDGTLVASTCLSCPTCNAAYCIDDVTVVVSA